MPDLILRAVEPGDCAAIVALNRASFPVEDIETSVFISPRVENYLRQLTAFPAAAREQFLWGAWKNDRLIGSAFGRGLPKSWHLNFLAVLPEEQKMGVGRALLEAWRQAGRERGFREYSLDVWQDNALARSWYQKLGWRETSQTWFYRREPAFNFESANDDFQLLNWENSHAWQACYGFSKLEISKGEKRWAIGRLGDDYFRASEILPQEIERFLHQLDPSRRLLLLLPDPLPGEEAWKISLRMEQSES